MMDMGHCVTEGHSIFIPSRRPAVKGFVYKGAFHDN